MKPKRTRKKPPPSCKVHPSRELALPNIWGAQIQKKISQLIQSINPIPSGFPNKDVVQEIVVTALKSVQAQIGRGDLKILSRAIRELRYAFKIFQTYRDIKKVTIFGSARTGRNDKNYQLAKDFAKKLTTKGYMIITGAGPGIMAAGNEGAEPGQSFGVNIRLPFEQHPNKYIARQPTYIDCHYFFTRKLIFIKETSATAFFPGGFGTLDEAFEMLTLVQTGKCDPMPILLLEAPKGTFWKELDHFFKTKLLKTRKISPEDVSLYKICHSANEAVEEIRNFYRNYHSIRYVKDNLVIRFQKPITPFQLETVNKKFKGLLMRGKWERSGPLPEEKNQPEIEHLPRLVGRFNRVNNGLLRKLIDYMNQS